MNVYWRASTARNSARKRVPPAAMKLKIGASNGIRRDCRWKYTTSVVRENSVHSVSRKNIAETLMELENKCV